MIEACQKAGVKALVYTSSASIVSDNTGDLINADERWPIIPAKATDRVLLNSTKVRLFPHFHSRLHLPYSVPLTLVEMHSAPMAKHQALKHHLRQKQKPTSSPRTALHIPPPLNSSPAPSVPQASSAPVTFNCSLPS